MFRALASALAMLALAGCQLLPEGDRGRGPRPPAESGGGTVSNNALARQCLAELGATGAAFTPLPDRYAGPGCSLLNTVELSRLAGDRGSFSISNLGPVACPTAQAFAAWARYGVDRAARVYLGSPVVRIETMGSYACRNVAGSGRRSAHATAEAIDIGAFHLADGRRISVLHDWDGGTAAEREFLRVVQRSACKRFRTVLGPEYNAAHRDHFHLERGGDGGFCR
ncbi:extensin family protein [Pelagerythrobacter marinus]|uniref:extensin family protein n=1 Tax=Pelagerythrobacter marinus TaxID=538382 RepID=UPI00203761AD|nr:extensin family protein [Pelagerythrobacter marinus]USA38635.1 extensin family protein [Pelagerythrobacter marinus]WPZ07338.1 extensin family protein [Pelagerythrobacter marinus]